MGDLNERVSKLEVNDTNKEGRLVLVEETIGSYNDTINGFEGRIVDMEEQLVNELEPMVESYNKLRPWIGEQSEIAKDPKDEEDSTTITETIGNIWDATKRIGVKEGKENIAGCLEKLNENLSTTDTQIKANLTATKVAL